MANKKKKTTNKKTTKKINKAVENSPLLDYSIGVVLILIFFLLLIGGFGSGGSLPVHAFKAVYWVFGYAAFVFTLLLGYAGVIKLKQEDKKYSLDKTITTILAFILTSAFFYVCFAHKNKVTNAYSGGHGGKVGMVLGKFIFNFLDKPASIILLLIFSALDIFYVLGIAPETVWSKLKSSRERQVDSEIAELKEKAASAQPSFKLNEGVPVEHSNVEEKPEPKQQAPIRLSNLKNSASKLAATENHEALITTSDPDWKFPGTDLLSQKQSKADAGDVKANAKIIHDTFENFRINVEMEGANIGPRVTQYTLKPPVGVKLTKITALENNLALDLAAHSIRMEAPIPGKRAVGIEVPNIKSATVTVSSLLSSREWGEAKSPLTVIIGKDISGAPVLADLAKMPHLLVAGQTGSGKSVMINDLLTSLLYRNSPSDLKLILVDPKQVELKPYDDIPHLLTPVITEPEKCISALKWAVAEMERRLRTLSEVSKRNIEEYNNLKKEEGMPYIVIVIDELADLMMMAARDVESLIVRIAQKARAVGIHLVLATQRPSVDVITGLIKANVPARLAFTTASQIDSRTIIDQMGAEKLLGQGDMLMLTSSMPKPRRVQAAFISDDETINVTDFIRMQRPPAYDDEIISQPVQIGGKGGAVADYGGPSEADDDMWRDAVRVVIENKKASTSLLQRRLRIGYGRAARLIENMEEQGIVGQADGSRPREVLISSMDDVFGDRAPANEGDDYASDETLES